MASPQPQSSSKKSNKKSAGKLPEGLTDARLVEAYENMQRSRMLDDKMLRMLKQGKSFFHIGCMGHEAVQTATAFALERGRD